MIVRKETKSGIRWKVIVSGTDPATGKRRRHTPVFPTKREAERAEAKLKTELNEGTHVARQNLKLAGYTKDWLPAMKAQVRPSTWESYERNIRVHVIPRIGGVSLQALTPTHLNKMYADLLADGRRPGKDRRGKGKGLSPRTVAYVHTILHRCLGDATRDGLVQRNVAALARPPKQGDSDKAKQRTWSAAELRAFLSHIEGDARPWLYPVVHVAGTTGLRRGEVLGLRWNRVDLDAARLSIQETVVCVGHEVRFSTPKTSKGKRSGPMIPPPWRCCGSCGRVRPTVAWIAPTSSSRTIPASPSIPRPCPWCSTGGCRRAGCPGLGFTTSDTLLRPWRCRPMSRSKWFQTSWDTPTSRSPATATAT